jgi:hypothetical protein
MPVILRIWKRENKMINMFPKGDIMTLIVSIMIFMVGISYSKLVILSILMKITSSSILIILVKVSLEDVLRSPSSISLEKKEGIVAILII